MIVDDKVFEFIYTIAMRDATQQKAYNLIGYKATKDAKKPDDYKKEVLLQNNVAKDIIREYIDNIISGNNPDFYIVEKAVEDSFSVFIQGKTYLSPFTFGNCQKLINMTVKYFYIVTYSDSTIRSYFNNCHCPMDNVMIKTVKRELKNNKIPLKDFKITSEELSKSWSRIVQGNTSQYDAFQEIVKYLAKQKGVSPIEYDYLMWK